LSWGVRKELEKKKRRWVLVQTNDEGRLLWTGGEKLFNCVNRRSSKRQSKVKI
jgi:hypothetical protein